MKVKIKRSYRGTEQLVYLICLLAWKNFIGYLAKFAAFNAKYTQSYANDAIAAAEAAAALPGTSARKAATKIIRDRLKKDAKKCRNLYQQLVRYIDNCYAADVTENMKQAAGAGYYAGASRNNWKDLSLLNAAATAFIEKYSTALQMEGKGMPADFATTFGTAKTDFDTQLEQYNHTKAAVMQQTAAKTEAFNQVYATLIGMLKDGRTIFADDKTIQDLFAFNSLAKLAGKTSRTGIHIELLDSITKLPVTTTRFVIEPGDVIGSLDSNGMADISLSAGKYSIVATTPGYNTLVLNDITVKKDTMRHIKMLLEKAVAVA